LPYFSRTVTIRAYAKINIGLHILGKRADGFHDIETVFHQINLYDTIALHEIDSDITFRCDDPTLPIDATNLCIRAARLLMDITGSANGVEIHLRKRIPVGAGLGGGSSDAAAVLKGMRQLLGLDISNAELRTLAASLGSDVPFFIEGGSAYATGRGELLETLDLDIPAWILVATPPVSISTAWAYSAVNPTNNDTPREDLRALLETWTRTPVTKNPSTEIESNSGRRNTKGDFSSTSLADYPRRHDALRSRLRNDFEPIVFEHYPEVAAIKRRMLDAGADVALMSGSGSTVFGLFQDEQRAQATDEQLRRDCRTSLTPPSFKPTTAD
jgi:4-diphosphocytidyl-2-C-methyl-D-erythritol kinase